MRVHLSETATLIKADALGWLHGLPERCLHAVVTDPPYGLIEYAARDHRKLRAGRGGVWRIPPQLDGVRRRPLPRFTVLSHSELEQLAAFSQQFPTTEDFLAWSSRRLPWSELAHVDGDIRAAEEFLDALNLI